MTGAHPIAVVGAGIIGVAIARALQKAGKPVVLFDAGEPGRGTSFGNAGYIAPDEIFPLTHAASWKRIPGMLFDPLGPLTIRWTEMPFLGSWFLRFALASRPAEVRKAAAALAALQQLSVPAWKKAVREEGLGHLVRARGSLRVYEMEKGFVATRAEREAQRAYGIKVEELPREACRQLVPELAESIFGGVFFPEGMHVTDPFDVVRALFRNFTAAGGRFVQERVTAVDRDGAALATESKTHPAAAVVVATGHRSGALLRPLGHNVPLIAERGYHAEVEHGKLKFDLPLGFYERGFYITPMTGGLRLAGTVEFSSAEKDHPPTWRRADILVGHARELLPGVTGREKSRWMGNRPTLPDFLPVLGRAPGSRGLYLAFGHQHLGLTLSMATSELISSLVATGKTAIDVKPFALERFQ